MWSQESGRIFFASNRGGDFDIYSQAADGSAPPQIELAAPGAQATQSFTPDGRLLIALDYKDIGLFTRGSKEQR